MELEHVVGFSGRFPKTLAVLHSAPATDVAVDESEGGADTDTGLTYVCAMGSNIAICSAEDPHAQVFLQAHDDFGSALAVDPSGRLLASGQVGSRRAAVCSCGEVDCAG